MNVEIPPLSDQSLEPETPRSPLLEIVGKSIISPRPHFLEEKMSINRRYGGVERQHASNRTFSNNNNNKQRAARDPPTFRVDSDNSDDGGGDRRGASQSYRKEKGKELRYGLDMRKRQQQDSQRYGAIAEKDESSRYGRDYQDMEQDSLDFDGEGRYEDVSRTDDDDRYDDDSRDSDGRTRRDDDYDVRIDTGRNDADYRPNDDDDNDDVTPGPDTYRYDRLFMSEEEMLDQSAAELKATIEELEKRFDAIENEGNEWKTRYETQEEMNQQLERQIILLQNKVEEARRNLREATQEAAGIPAKGVKANKTPRDSRNFDDLSDASPQMIKALEREKNLLMNQLRDLEWRLDQESKAYHKANDERKQYVLEINAAKGTISEMKNKQRMLGVSPSHENGSSPRSHRDTGGNIPSDHRIIDPKKGPIRKTAGVKSLPSLEP